MIEGLPNTSQEEVSVEETNQTKMRHKSFHGLKSESYVSSMNIDENSLLNTDNGSGNQSSNNWQNYFNNKMSFSTAKEKQTVRDIDLSFHFFVDTLFVNDKRSHIVC